MEMWSINTPHFQKVQRWSFPKGKDHPSQWVYIRDNFPVKWEIVTDDGVVTVRWDWCEGPGKAFVYLPDKEEEAVEILLPRKYE